MAMTAVLTVAATGFAMEKPAPVDPALFRDLERFHGHTCAGSLMGARLGIAAKVALKAAGGEGKLKARYSNHSCPVDGIQLAAGTTCGNKAIEVVDEKEHRLLLTAENNSRQVEARLTRVAEEKGRKYKDLKTKAAALPVASPERQRLEKSVEEVLDWFRTARDGEVVQVKVVR